jgi:hypothetical protein
VLFVSLGKWSASLGGIRNRRVFQDPDPLDFNFYFIPGFHRADACGGSRRDDIARMKGRKAADVGNQAANREDHHIRVRRLNDLPIEAGFNPTTPRLG